ncbi:MAG TPA: histidine kinase [Bradyrhizobium sp.]|nr:histidine kinase [Bradyrhizobium sp.]
MSIRRYLILAVIGVLCITLIFGGLLTYFHAVRKVRTEMQAALSVGAHFVQNALDDSEEIINPRRRLRLVVADFDGDRHLVASLVTDKNVILAISTPLAPEEPAPDWFVRLVGGQPLLAYPELPAGVADGGRILLQSNAVNEVAEAWSDVRLTAATLIAFCVMVLLLSVSILARALRRIGDVCSALSRVGEGDYSARLCDPVPSELEPLKSGFNTMAERLAEVETVNRSLTKQIVNLQEEERAQIARDLHDEIGPFLFATGADATMIRQFIATSAFSEAQARSEAIVESVRHMQRHLRSILGRLRPGILIDLGLNQAIRGLLDFWRIRRSDINFAMEGPTFSFGRRLDDIIFRVVQESLNNAVRHAKPSDILVSISRVDQVVYVEIKDDGIGFEPTAVHAGFGLALLRQKFIRTCRAVEARQHGHRGKCLTRASMMRRRTVAIEFGT